MKISVCMATYNGASFLKEQIDSILIQLGSDDELIISDDGSTDNTLGIIKSYSDKRIKVYHSDKRNLIANFENALNKATGDIIFLSDQDDIWFSNKVEKCRECLKDSILVFSNALIFNDENPESSRLFFRDKRKKTGIVNNLIKVKFLGATLAFKKEILKRALPFPKNIPMHDIWLGLIAESLGTTCYIAEPLIYYRRHRSAVSATGGKSNFSFSKKIRIRVDLIISLIARLLK